MHKLVTSTTSAALLLSGMQLANAAPFIPFEVQEELSGLASITGFDDAEISDLTDMRQLIAALSDDGNALGDGRYTITLSQLNGQVSFNSLNNFFGSLTINPPAIFDPSYAGSAPSDLSTYSGDTVLIPREFASSFFSGAFSLNFADLDGETLSFGDGNNLEGAFEDQTLTLNSAGNASIAGIDGVIAGMLSLFIDSIDDDSLTLAVTETAVNWIGFEAILNIHDTGTSNQGVINGAFLLPGDSTDPATLRTALETLGVGLEGQQLASGGFQVTAVPEPATLAILSLGLAGLGFQRRRQS